jgi:glycosyltransferase involved in cell wall biosynthesis
LRVLHLSTYDGGQGAARATYRLHQALRASGMDSRMRVARASRGDSWVDAPRSKPRQALALLRSTASWWLSKPQRSANPITHSVAALPSRLDLELNRRPQELLHLHWLQDEFLSVEAIGRLRGPVLWTMHDCWPLCGAEHYPHGLSDQRFAQGYGAATRPRDHRGLDLDRWTWQRKRGAWRSLLPQLQLIAPSHWMAQQAAASALLAGVPCRVIPNALPEVFRPYPRAQVRGWLGWPQHKRLVLFGAMDGVADPRKGFDLLVDALQQFKQLDPGLSEHCCAAVLGQSTPAVPPSLPLPVHYAGRLDDDLSLALAYAAADVVVVPSRLDNLPQSATEPLACGTPVVAFRQGGLPDLVQHRRNGWLAAPEDARDLALGLQWALEQPEGSLPLEICKSWRPEAVARAHRDLYAEVLHQ